MNIIRTLVSGLVSQFEALELALAVVFIGAMPRMIFFKKLLLDDPDVHVTADCIHILFNGVLKTLWQFSASLSFCSLSASSSYIAAFLVLLTPPNSFSPIC